jgi:hypothetical protein
MILAPQAASANLIFHAQASHNVNSSTISQSTCNPLAGVNLSSGSPVAGTVVCGNSQGTEQGAAGADFGHVGASALAATTAQGAAANVGAVASFYDDNFVFTANNAANFPGGVPVSLNLVFDGDISTTIGGGAQITFSVLINSSTVGFFDRRESNGVLFSCTSTFGNTGGACDVVLAGGSHSVVSATTVVPLNTPVSLFLDLEVAGFASSAGATGGADFGHSFDFPLGTDLFNLPQGVTVDEPDTFVTDNRFAPGGPSPVPEPASIAILALGLCVFGMKRLAKFCGPLTIVHP